MTRWRDWVIDAFNQNMPFDQFTVEQLAGDLLPDATLAQKVASGFHRNHMINFEGGAIPRGVPHGLRRRPGEHDGTVWLGLTLGCAQCHDHKFDPFTQKDFYRLYAFFNNVPENGLDGNKGNAVPCIKVPTPDQAERARRPARPTSTAGQEARRPAAGDRRRPGRVGDGPRERQDRVEAARARRSSLDRAGRRSLTRQGRLDRSRAARTRRRDVYTFTSAATCRGSRPSASRPCRTTGSTAKGPGRSVERQLRPRPASGSAWATGRTPKPVKVTARRRRTTARRKAGSTWRSAIDGKPGPGWAILPEPASRTPPSSSWPSRSRPGRTCTVQLRVQLDLRRPPVRPVPACPATDRDAAPGRPGCRRTSRRS